MNYQYPYNNTFNGRKRNESTYLTKLIRQLAVVLIVMLLVLLCKYAKTGPTEMLNNKIKSILYLDYTKEVKGVFENYAPDIEKNINKILNKFNINKEFAIDYWPCDGKIILSFGKSTDPKTKKIVTNNGVNIEAKENTNVKAVYDGTVDSIENNAMGLTIVIDHHNGYKTVYSNLAEHSVSIGESITKGSVIAKSGSGISGSPSYFHFEILKNNIPVNPENYYLKSN